MSNKYWTDKTDGVDVASAKDLNKAFDSIAEDLSNVNIEVDSTPTQGSNKPVSSNGVYEALENKQDKGTVPDNVVTTDMANKANGYAALDSNKGIEVEKVNFPTTNVNEEDAFTTLTKDSLTINGDGFFNVINGVYGQKLIGFCASSGLGTEFYLSPDSGRVTLECTEDNKAISAISLASYYDNTIQNWSADTNLKNKSVVATVYDNYQKAKLLQKNTSTGYYEISKGLMGPGGNLFIELGMYGRINVPMGYYGETGAFHTIQFSSSNATSPKWIDGTNTITLYNAGGVETSGKEFLNFHTALNGKSIFAKLTDLITEVNNKQNKSTYVMDGFATTKTVTMNNNTEYLYYGKGEFTELTLDFAPAGSEDYSSYISFQSGETPTVFNVTGSGGSGGTSIIFRGDDCDSSGVFTPQANKGYEIAFKCIGITSDATFHIVGRVGAC